MFLIKLTLKLMALPLVAAITLIQWVAIFFTSFSAVIFNLLAGLFFLVAVAGYFMQTASGSETVKMLAVAFAVFIVPYIAEWFIMRIATINYGLRDFIKSRP